MIKNSGIIHQNPVIHFKGLAACCIVVISAFVLLSCVEDDFRLENKVKEASEKALNSMQELQNNGGWAAVWTTDGSATFGEWLLREDDIITIQPPGTPAIGAVYLRAYEVLKDSMYLETAIEAGGAVLNGQFAHGGFPQEYYPEGFSQDPEWFQNYDTTGNALFDSEMEGANIYIAKNGPGTFDDQTTQSAALYLLELWQVTGEPRFKDAALKSAEFMLNAQYSNGGWPQKYPLQDNYTRFITLNDGAMPDVISTLFTFSEVLGDSRYQEAAMNGAEYLLQVQAGSSNKGWAQQYNLEGEPQGARPWEPAALSASESVDVIEFLMDVYMRTGDKKYIQSGKVALDWLERSRLDNGKWARYYELETNRPVYSGKDNRKVYDPAEAFEYHPGYSWQGNYLDSALVKQYDRLLNAPASERFELVGMPDDNGNNDGTSEALSIISEQNDDGLWTTEMSGETLEFYQLKFGRQKDVPELIDAGMFVDNVNVLLSKLDS